MFVWSSHSRSLDKSLTVSERTQTVVADLVSRKIVSFDVLGAFDGVHPSVRAGWLRERKVPGDLVA
jgi:hypothetical protein